MAGLNREIKQKDVETFRKTLTPVQAAVIGQCSGINVEIITALRSKVRASGAQFKIVKNTLAAIAVEGTALEGLKDHFTGPTALAYTENDPVALAKVLSDFAKSQDKFKIRAGVLNGSLLDTAQVNALANVPSREVLLGRLAGALQAPYANFAYAMSGILRKLVYALDAVRREKEKQGV